MQPWGRGPAGAWALTERQGSMWAASGLAGQALWTGDRARLELIGNMRLFPGAPACVCFVVLALVVLGSGRGALRGEALSYALRPDRLGGLRVAGAVPALHHRAPVLALLPRAEQGAGRWALIPWWHGRVSHVQGQGSAWLWWEQRLWVADRRWAAPCAGSNAWGERGDGLSQRCYNACCCWGSPRPLVRTSWWQCQSASGLWWLRGCGKPYCVPVTVDAALPWPPQG